MSDQREGGIAWTDNIAGFPGYHVESDGSLWTRWAYNGRNPRRLGAEWRRMNPTPDGDGYLAVNLYRGGHANRRKVHLIVLEAFVSPRPDGMEGCHENGVVSDCRAANLRWDTPKHNQRDRVRHGTHCRGERSPKAKLTEGEAAAIKRRLADGALSKSLAMEFGVAPSTIAGIKAGRLWGWL